MPSTFSMIDAIPEPLATLSSSFLILSDCSAHNGGTGGQTISAGRGRHGENARPTVPSPNKRRLRCNGTSV